MMDVSLSACTYESDCLRNSQALGSTYPNIFGNSFAMPIFDYIQGTSSGREALKMTSSVPLLTLVACMTLSAYAQEGQKARCVMGIPVPCLEVLVQAMKHN